MAKMNVLTFRRTGHVLGTVTRSVRSDVSPTVDDIAANGFLLRDDRGVGLETTIDAAELAVEQVAVDTRTYYRPQLFVVAAGQIEQKAPLVPSSTLQIVALASSKVTVSLPDNVPDAVDVVLHVSGGLLANPVVQLVTIPKLTKTGTEALTLPNGNYSVAVFAPEFGSVLLSVKLP
jgi:hypothetical protein